MPRMEAEVLFDDPDKMNVGKAELQKLGFEVEVLDWYDPLGTPVVWVMARIDSEQIANELDGDAQGSFLTYVNHIVEPPGLGWVVEAGFVDPRVRAALSGRPLDEILAADRARAEARVQSPREASHD